MRLQTIGADPEIFVADATGITSVIGHLGGTKYEPRMLNGYGLQEDNVLAEFSMPPVPAVYGSSANRFSDAVRDGVRHINNRLRAKGLKTCRGSSHVYDPDQLKSYGPAALEFGCDPDRNAYTGENNPTPDQSSLLRTAGGHIHIGIKKSLTNDDTVNRMMAMAMDLFVGVPSVLLDTDNRRRELYGKAGAFRDKPYGIEYRTLSNFWIHKRSTRVWAFYATRTAIENADHIHMLHKIVSPEMIQDCINTGNVELAREIMAKMNIGVPNAQAA